MGILLIDTSSRKIEFGYADSERIIFKEELSPDHNADTLIYFIKKSFEKNKINFKEIKIVSLSNGPGSFTGLRIGSAIAKGICFALDCKLIEIPSLDIIANKFKSDKKIISLVFSNTKTLEFYYCEYEFESGKLKRISDYKIDSIENILNEDADYIINESFKGNIDKKYTDKLTDVSGITNIDSQFELIISYLKEKKFSNYRTSEPFYMKEFVPKN